MVVDAPKHVENEEKIEKKAYSPFHMPVNSSSPPVLVLLSLSSPPPPAAAFVAVRHWDGIGSSGGSPCPVHVVCHRRRKYSDST